ncbi:MipA/OmpV family protein [Salipiger sp. 1_MG-2023]|uniref:MipA/OmpV family protein n=1 Tax=Salipiger sp. 1_MG-2023 TaxID=3062665 RepID=UPI0026E35332|nr:MipA/OmpV family protein [Salipiger sp. 1_MG-2023]MDO6586010.1 MipA/OmpV family protein [Salipiger sp. 1_MG-2023]
MFIARLAYCLPLAAALIAGTASAQEAVSTQGTSPGVVFSLRGGVASAPDFFGSDDYTAGPDLGFSFHGLTLNNGFSLGDSDPWNDAMGLGFGGSFRFIPERDSSDHDTLRGMDDIDATVELGFGVSYTGNAYEVFGNVRRGFGGSEAWVGEAGMDIIARPDERWKLTMGPRLFWGNDSYANTYFGVDSDEATASRSAFDADGGLLSAGVEMGASYQLNDDWGIEGAVTWENYRNDAADSPIVDDTDQWTVRLGVTRVMRLRF